MISLRYRINNSKKVKKFSCPTSMAEMSSVQLTFFYKFLMGEENKQYAIVPIMWQLPLKDLALMDEEQRHLLLHTFLDNLDHSGSYFIENYDGLVAPATGMKTATWEQYYLAHHYLEAYKETKDNTSFHKFLATLYTPLGEAFNANQIENNYSRFRIAHAGFCFGAMLAFGAITENLKKRFPQVFSKPALGIATTSTPKSNWLEVSLSMCDNDPVRLTQLNQQNMYLVLKAMDQKLKTQTPTVK